MSRVLVIGAGGLGCPALWALGASGRALDVSVADGDVVDVSNLHRQILYGVADVGRAKVEAARAALARHFPTLALATHAAHLAGAALATACAAAEVVLDCTDGRATKLAIHDACRAARVPLVHGAAVGLGGQLTTFAGDGPCLRCLFDDLPADGDEDDSCATYGILGPVAGVVGALMAEEALAVLDGAPRFVGRLHVYAVARAPSDVDVRFAPRRGCRCRAAHPERSVS